MAVPVHSICVCACVYACRCMCACVYVCACVCICVCVYVCVHHMCMRVHVCDVCACVYMSTCMCVYGKLSNATVPWYICKIGWEALHMVAVLLTYHYRLWLHWKVYIRLAAE